MRNISFCYLLILLILVTGCSKQDNIVIIEGNNIKNVNLVYDFYSNVQNNEPSTLVIENRNGIEGQKSVSTYKFDGTSISYEVVEPKEIKVSITVCKTLEKERKVNFISYNLSECDNTGLGKNAFPIIEIPK